MSEQLKKAIDLLEAVQLDLINNEVSFNAVLVEQLGEFVDDYYSEMSFLNENIYNIIKLKDDSVYNEDGDTIVTSYSKQYAIQFLETSTKSLIIAQHLNSNREYESVYKQEGEELIIIQPFEEI